ncbi:MAG: efflux RND transporter periplasmic adaptor subunit [Chloroherpetonaceae bacterium]|nr:efflux RND transporter periplasmic adaptor subunit [Chthonomonadaceae bacterium]MDW8206627.1 efflux RND transporter periplasmic adaptor subunit [Chloroherpetonaceae bacterium]
MIKRLFFTLASIAIVGVGAFYVVRGVRAGSAANQKQYRIATVERGTVRKTVTATGILKAWTTVDIKSRAGGRVDRLYVEDGSIVRKGDVIAEIDPSDTLLSLNTAKADIAANDARITQAEKELRLQQQQTAVSLATAEANLKAAKAAAAAAKARYESARQQAEAQRELTEAAIENARATLAAARERLEQLEKATQPQSRAAAQAAVDQAQANLKNAELQLSRQKALLEKGFVAASAVDQAQANYEVAKATLASALERLNTIRPEQEADIKAQRAQVRQAEAALRSAEAGRVDIALRKQNADAALAEYERALADVRTAEARVQQAKAEQINNTIRLTQIAQARAQRARSEASLSNAQVQYQDTRVTAPTDGIILKKYIEQGTIISSGMSFNTTGVSIVQLGDISRMYVDVQVDETDIANVDLDQKVDITFDAYPTTPFEGKVIKIDPQAVVEQNVTTIHVRVEVDNTSTAYRLLKPGMNATCDFIVERKEDVIMVPNEAIRNDEEGNKYVEIPIGGTIAPLEKDADPGAKPDPNLLVGVKPERRVIQIGIEGNETTEVLEGLKEGDKVITQIIEPAPPTPGGNPFGGSRGPGRR